MRDLVSLRPSADLVEEGDSEQLRHDRRRAALAIADHAEDAQECAEFLEMLGLHTGPRARS